MHTALRSQLLNLRVGEIVEVRSENDILATLDEHGKLDGLPFMPEMLEFCGRRFTVYKRADTTCDGGAHIRRMHNAVHLEGLRCDGSSHGGCQASCLLFWKEVWLTRVDSASVDLYNEARVSLPVVEMLLPVPRTSHCTHSTLLQATHKPDEVSEPVYMCQATEIKEATSVLLLWDIRQYLRNLRSGNNNAAQILRGLLIKVFNGFQGLNSRFFPRVLLIKGGKKYPFFEGKVTSKTPREVLNLQPGELVEIKSLEEIEQTLDRNGKNRGLEFSLDEVPYCGRLARVLKRVNRIIDEKTGKMISIGSDCIILEGVICTGEYRCFCSRSIYSYWREIWLKRVD